MLLYTVQQGDSLYSIAERYRIPAQLLSDINGLKQPDTLLVGQSLIIAKPTTTHKVNQGETVYSIAREYRISVSELFRNNPSIIENATLAVGKELVIRYEGQSEQTILVNGYAYPFINESTLQKTLPYLSTLALFSYGFTSEGDLVINADDTLIEKAKLSGVNPIIVLSSLNDHGQFGFFDQGIVGIYDEIAFGCKTIRKQSEC